MLTIDKLAKNIHHKLTGSESYEIVAKNDKALTQLRMFEEHEIQVIKTEIIKAIEEWFELDNPPKME